MAIFRFDNFCEQFATVYTPISHVSGKNSKQKRFFRHDSIDERLDVLKNLTGVTKCTLFMSCITAFDGELVASSEQSTQPNFYAWRRHVMFWAKGADVFESKAGAPLDPMDEISAADAKARGVECATDFIAFIRALAEDRKSVWGGLDLDSMQVVTLPVSYNGWWITCINFDQLEPRQKCVIDSKYDESLIATLFEGTPVAKLITQ